MGCLCSKSSAEEEVIELSPVTNTAVMCKAGKKGDKVQVANSPEGYVVKGEGIFIGSCPLDCDTGRWEVVVRKGSGNVCIGVMRYRKTENTKSSSRKTENPENSVDLSKTLVDYQKSDQCPSFFFDPTLINDGDVVGVFWDQTDMPMLSFTVNGKVLHSQSVNRIRPSQDLYASISVSGDAEAVVVFDEANFKFPPISSKFKMIICSTSLI
eukprot:gene28270-34137_t